MALSTSRGWDRGAAFYNCADMLRLLILGVIASAALSAQPVTVYIELGDKAKAVEDWSGSLTVSGGELLGLESRHFSKGETISGANSWKTQTRREQIDGFAKVNYNEMSPAELPPTQFSPVGVYATLNSSGSTQVAVKTAQGDFRFRLAEIGVNAKPFLDGRVGVALSPRAEVLSTPDNEDDEAAITTLPNGDTVVAWVAYRDRGDRVMLRTRSGGTWSAPEEVSESPGDLFRCSLAVDADGGLWAFWSRREGTVWDIWGRRKANGSWGSTQKISSGGSNTFHRAASSANGDVFVVWQSHQGKLGQQLTDIYGRRWSQGEWSDATRLSESPANDWEPFVAGGPGGRAYAVWDSYDAGNYDVFFREFDGEELGPIRQVTTSPRFQAHATVAADPQGRPWVAWDESGVNWGKDQGYLVTPPMAVPLHQERSLRLAMWDGSKWHEPKQMLQPFYVYRLFPNFETPQIAFDGEGVLNMIFRHWTRQEAHGIGSKIMWENFLTRYDGRGWTLPVPLAHSAGSIEKRAALTREPNGSLAAAWMTDDRPFTDMIPRNAEIYFAELGKASEQPSYAAALKPFVEEFAEALPIHPFEAENVKAIRAHVIEADGKQYRIYRGDMHRHTDVSQDFKYDGSLIEVYRYAMDVTSFDYMVPTDHQLGYDQEFTWWQDQKLTDLFNVPGAFMPLFGYERSLPFPNGHRNIVQPERGTRPLPIPDDEMRGDVRTGVNLYPYLKKNNGISMPHSSGTAQGTDWGDNDPEVEPLMEIYQGYRASYEYMGAPLAASPEKLREQRSGFNPLGYYWNALAKGYKIGVQASSDHWSTHVSYAMIVSDDYSREGLFNAMKKRHAYAATDNIILDFRAESGGKTYIMGDIIQSDEAPRLTIQAIGTDRIKQLVIVKNQQIIYERHPNADSTTLRFSDNDFKPGKNYYYVRVVQNDDKVAWSSPIWVE